MDQAFKESVLYEWVGECLSLKVTHPDGCMSQFVQYFEEQVMVLWKFALLRRRILIFSPPPVGEVCYRGKEILLAWNIQ